MYLETKSNLREGWRFDYLGSELLKAAKDRYAEYYQKEKEARKTVTDLLTDMGVSKNDERVVKAERDINRYGELREQSLVWEHEFQRKPDRAYNLAMSDVVFFDLVTPYDPDQPG